MLDTISRVQTRIIQVAVLAGGLAILLGGCVHPKPDDTANLQRFEFTRPQMGVPFRIVLYATDSTAAIAVSTSPTSWTRSRSGTRSSATTRSTSALAMPM